MSTLRTPVTAADHAQGPPDAPVTLVEYGDYQCPYCGAAHPIVKALQDALGQDLRFVFRNFPLSQVHPHALLAAQAAEAAGGQSEDAFWRMHDRLFENQHLLSPPHLIAHAEALGLDVQRFQQDLENETYLPRVQADFRGGVRSGVNGTPTFFINDVRHDAGNDAESLLAAIRQAAH